MKPGHRHLEHTADLRLELWADTEEALLAEAARAVVSALTEGARIEPKVERHVQLASSDPEDRLIRWMNEIIYLAVTRGFLVAEADVTVTPEGLDARLSGEEGAWHRVRTELKAATWHELTLVREGGRLVARVVVDV
ncbi:MAG: hypothetical protein AMXMBFR64_38080 [Myxococcales bacterium]